MLWCVRALSPGVEYFGMLIAALLGAIAIFFEEDYRSATKQE